MPVCKKCDAPIRFFVTTAGKFMPVDREKVAGGTLELAADRRTVRVVAADLAVRRYVSHYATCPNANDFRSGRSSGAAKGGVQAGTAGGDAGVAGVQLPGDSVGADGAGRRAPHVSGGGATRDSAGAADRGFTLPLPWGRK